jgi:hypothetical protein
MSRLGVLRNLALEFNGRGFFSLDRNRADWITGISGIKIRFPTLGNRLKGQIDLDGIFRAIDNLRVHRDFLSLSDS